MGIDHQPALDAFRKAYDGVDRLADELTRDNLIEFSRCRGWLVTDVLFHLLCDAQRALVALASPHSGPATRDFVSYWHAFGGDDDPLPGVWSIRRSAAAFRDGLGSIVLWHETAPAAVRAATAADPHAFLATQGQVLALPDLLATFTTEAAIHHLDITVNLPGAPAPHPDALATAAATLDGLAGSGTSRPHSWTTEEYVLKATGRVPLTDAERRLVTGYPLLS